MNPQRTLKYAPLVVLAVVLVVAYWRLFIGEAFFWGLPALQFVPWRAYGFDAIRAGQFPLWNPYNGGGTPLFANYQSAFLYPLNWVGVLVANYAALGWLMSITAVLHLFVGGWGMWCFAGRVGVPDVGRGVAALAFALTSYVVGRLGTYPTVSVTAWIPFLLWAAAGVITHGRRRDAAWLALFVGLVLTAGHAQTAWYALLLTGLYSLWLVLRYSRRDWWRLGIALGAVILGAGVASMQLLATADLLANSQRSAGYGAEAAAMNFSYAPLRAVNLFAPNLYGNPGDGSYLARGLFYEEAVYVGLLPLIAAFVAIAAWVSALVRRRTQPDDENTPGTLSNWARADVPFWTLVLVVGFIFAMGRHTPIFLFLYRNVPTFDMFQAPVRWHIWTVTALSVLAGGGVAQWGAGMRVVNWTRRALVGAVGALLIAGASPLFLPPETVAIPGVRVLIREVMMTALWVALAGGLTLLYAPNVPTRFRPLPAWWGVFWGLLVLVVVAADLGWATRGLNPTVPAAFYNPLPDSETAPDTRTYWTQEALDLVLFGQRVTADGLQFVDPQAVDFEPWLDGQDYRIAQENWEGFRQANLPNMNLLDRTYTLNNFDPLLLADYAALVENLPDDEQALAAAVAGYGVGSVYTGDSTIDVEDPTSEITLLFAPDDYSWWLVPGALTSVTALVVLIALFALPSRRVQVPSDHR